MDRVVIFALKSVSPILSSDLDPLEIHNVQKCAKKKKKQQKEKGRKTTSDRSDDRIRVVARRAIRERNQREANTRPMVVFKF